jgi:hypothetical protein
MLLFSFAKKGCQRVEAMQPTNAKGNARLLLKHIYGKLGETQQTMKPAEYASLAAQIGISHEQAAAAIRQLKAELLFRFYPETTQNIVLTQKGVQQGDYLKSREEHPLLGDPLPDSLEGVHAELAHFSLERQKQHAKSHEFAMISARIEELQHREGMMLKHSGSPNIYNQNITQHGGVMNASQTGNVSAQQLTIEKLNHLRPALAEVRSAFKKQDDSIDADECVGLLASAEKAAKEANENKMLGFLKQIPERTWEIGKVVIPQVLLSYLKAHGMIRA